MRHAALTLAAVVRLRLTASGAAGVTVSRRSAKDRMAHPWKETAGGISAGGCQSGCLLRRIRRRAQGGVAEDGDRRQRRGARVVRRRDREPHVTLGADVT